MSARLTIVREQKHGEAVARGIVSVRVRGSTTRTNVPIYLGILEGADGTVVRLLLRSDLRAYNRNDGVTSSRLCRKQQQHLRARVVVRVVGRSERG